MADELGKLTLQPCELEETDWSVEFNEEIHIAVLSTLIASERAEERQLGHTKDVQQWAAIV